METSPQGRSAGFRFVSIVCAYSPPAPCRWHYKACREETQSRDAKPLVHADGAGRTAVKQHRTKVLDDFALDGLRVGVVVAIVGRPAVLLGDDEAAP